MTDSEAKKIAARTHAVIKSNAMLDKLMELARAESCKNDDQSPYYDQWLMILFDLIGINIDMFEGIKPKVYDGGHAKAERRASAEKYVTALHPLPSDPHADPREQSMAIAHFMQGYDYRENNMPHADAVIHATGVLSKMAEVLEFIDATREMRVAQRSFFKFRKNGNPKEVQDWLMASKRLEKKVDDLLAKFEAKQNNSQTKMF